MVFNFGAEAGFELVVVFQVTGFMIPEDWLLLCCYLSIFFLALINGVFCLAQLKISLSPERILGGLWQVVSPKDLGE